MYTEASRASKYIYNTASASTHPILLVTLSNGFENRRRYMSEQTSATETRAMSRADYARQWRANNLEKKRAYRRAYRARKKGAGGSHTVAEWLAVKQAYNYTCLRCNRREPEVKLTPDHIQPVSRGGSDSIANIQPLCKDCNAWKSAKMIDYRGAKAAEQERLAVLLGPAARWSPEARKRQANIKRQQW